MFLNKKILSVLVLVSLSTGVFAAPAEKSEEKEAWMGKKTFRFLFGKTDDKYVNEKIYGKAEESGFTREEAISAGSVIILERILRPKGTKVGPFYVQNKSPYAPLLAPFAKPFARHFSRAFSHTEDEWE